MRALFVALPEKGHLHPLIGPAEALAARGHEVAFYTPCAVDVAIGDALARFARVFVGADDAPAATHRGAALAELTRDPPRLRRFIKQLLLDGVRQEVERLAAVVQTFRPDVLAADSMAYAAPLVAALTHRPWLSLSTSLNPVVSPLFASELAATVAELQGARSSLLASYGVRGRFALCDWLSSWGTMVFATEALVGAGPFPPGVELVGPSLPRGARGDEPAFEWARLDGRPLVYLSLGSQNWHQPRIVDVVVGALGKGALQLVVSAGELAASPLLREVIAVPYAPQRALLERAEVAITHGGANSIMEAMTAGVPLLVTPLCNDQLHNAAVVVASGAGLALDLTQASPGACRAAVERLRAPSSFAEAAARIGASYRARSGAELVAHRLERIV